MPCGRMAAQCAHIGGKLALKFKNVPKMTTLILELQDSYSFEPLKSFLAMHKISFIEQRDNLSDYPKFILQAVATEPISQKQAEVLKTFRLWLDESSLFTHSSAQSTRF